MAHPTRVVQNPRLEVWNHGRIQRNLTRDDVHDVIANDWWQPVYHREPLQSNWRETTKNKTKKKIQLESKSVKQVLIITLLSLFRQVKLSKSPLPVKSLAGNSNSEMTYFVSSGVKPYNSDWENLQNPEKPTHH